MLAQPRGRVLARALVRVAAVAGGATFALLAPLVAANVPTAGWLRLAAGLLAAGVGVAAALWALLAPPVTARRAPAGTVLLSTAGLLAAGSAGIWALAQATGSSAVVLAQGAGQALAAATPSDLLFWATTAVVLAGAAGTAFSRNIVYSAFSLLATLVGVAILYVYLSADFLAVTQVLIYVGGVLVLILFAIMLTNQIGDDVRITNASIGLPMGLALGAIMAATLLYVAARGPFPAAAPQYAEKVAPLGDAFLREYLLPFEVASVLLLASLVGAVVMARKEIDGKDEAQE